jgi:hypothetical protein
VTSSYMLPAGETTDSLSMRRRLAMALAQKNMQPLQVDHWTQGLAHVVDQARNGYEMAQIDREEKDETAKANALMASLFTGGQGAAPAAAPTTAPSPAPVSAQPGTPNARVADAFVALDKPDLTTAISDVAAARGVPAEYLTRTAALESRGDTNAANPNSSARGPFQFLKSTAAQYGLNDPSDPRASADAAARLAMDNRSALAKALKRDPSNAELYLAHQQGATGAAKLLANPDAPVETVIGPEAARLNGATPGMTAGQFAQKWTSKYDGPQMAQALSGPPAGPQVAQAGPNREAVIQMLGNRKTAPFAQKIISDQIGQQFKPQDYDIQQRPDGTVIAVGKRNPNDVKVINAPGAGQSAIKFEADKAAAVAKAKGEAEKLVGQEQRTKEEKQVGSIVVQDIDRAIKTMDTATLPTTGALGPWVATIGGTAANDVRSLVDTVKANAGFAELQKMRNNSPTGGALGQVSEREIAYLQSTIGNLDQSQSAAQFKDNLRRVKNTYLDLIHGEGKGPPRETLTFQEKQQQGSNIDDLLKKYGPK